MTLSEVLDGSFAILKTRTREVLVLSAVFVVPVNVLSALLLRDSLGGGFDLTGSGGGEGGGFDVGATVLTAALSAISLALLAGAMAQLVTTWYLGVTVDLGQVIRQTLRRSPALIVAVIAVHLAEAVALLGLLVGAIVPMVFFMVVSPVIVVESLGPFAAMKRSWRLVKKRFGASLGVALTVALLSQAVSFGFVLVPELATAVSPDDWDWVVRSMGVLVSELVVTPFAAGAAVLYYLDLRIRTEGIDLVRRSELVFDA